MNVKRLLIPTLPVLAAFAIAAAPAGAQTDTQAAVSENWAGYAVGGSDTTTNFSDVSGDWVQPTATCNSGATYSAFWVGLGGSSQTSDALEQAGTQSDCSASGQATYYAWYELVPSAPVKLAMTVSPGDKMSSNVSVTGNAVTITVSNATTGQSVTKHLTASTVDTSSAEWIAEAPSECTSTSDCQPLALADFGKATFTNATATANGHTGSISDSDWSAQPVALSPATAEPGYGYGDGYGGGVPGAGLQADGSQSSSAGATPTTLSSDGSSFSVAYEADGTAATAGDSGSTSTSTGTGSGVGGDGAGGYGYGGYGYGYGGYGQSAYGDGDGDGGYGQSAYGYGDTGQSGYGYGYGGYGDYGAAAYGAYGDAYSALASAAAAYGIY